MSAAETSEGKEGKEGKELDTSRKEARFLDKARQLLHKRLKVSSLLLAHSADLRV